MRQAAIVLLLDDFTGSVPLGARLTGQALPRAVLPGIPLDSPKITLTTAWFAQRVQARWTRCMGR